MSTIIKIQHILFKLSLIEIEKDISLVYNILGKHKSKPWMTL